MSSLALSKAAFLIIAITITCRSLTVAADSDNNATVGILPEAESVDYHLAMLDAVNKERSAYGLPKLCLNDKLRNAALVHSRDMAQKSFLGHTGSDGSTMSSRVRAAGYQWMSVAENVAAGQDTVTSVVADWMKSKPHRANILSPRAKMFECGYAYSSSSKYKHYWTQNFASGTGEKCLETSSVSQDSFEP